MSVARYTPPYTLELALRCGLSRESLRAVPSRYGEVVVGPERIELSPSG